MIEAYKNGKIVYCKVFEAELLLQITHIIKINNTEIQ